jgi:glycosyltransferase involved in cell wall biosynthesis
VLPVAVVHYAGEDPRTSIGGVQRFGRNLERIFAEVRYLTPRSRNRLGVLRDRLPIICDNHYVLDWPAKHPVIGFQHGVAEVKYQATRSLGHWWLARKQRRAAARPNTLFVACAEWVGRTFGQLYGNAARRVVYYPVDTDRFDGRLENAGSRIVLHDARTRHKGKRLIPGLQAAFPEWRFEPLACPPDEVPGRMRRAAAFVHLSRYEGNSLVCGEAMGMDLPCLFSRVGLFQDPNGPTDYWPVDPALLDDPGGLEHEVGAFLESLATRRYHPRAWVLANATLQHAESSWRAVLQDFQDQSGWDLGLDRGS